MSGRQLTKRMVVVLVLFSTFVVFGASAVFAAYMEHFGILECFDCHDFNQDPQINLDWIRPTIATPNSGNKPVAYSNREGANSLADGDETYDGACEVCHTQTVYHTNTGDSTTHFDGTRCTTCHDHFPGSGRDFFTPQLPGPQSHEAHLNAKKGPKIADCTDCHDAVDFGLFADGKSLSLTDVCDGCHSPGGAYNGVSDVIVGAKSNWSVGVYEAGSNTLKEDKEDWCKTCHDAGVSVVKGVAAPNVVGDNATYGFNVSGHGKLGIDSTCVDCHDASYKHADHKSRTYQADLDNYLNGYRLLTGMHVPRFQSYGPEDFQLCMSCHNYDKVFGELSNFRNETTLKLLHDYHLGDLFQVIYAWDSDWDDEIDSAMSCPACHNVHGSPSPAMARHGELISTPGTTDKVPALDLRWYLEDNVTETSVFPESRYGGLLCGIIGDLSYNHVCYGCHETGRLKYYREPTGVPRLLVNGMSTKSSFIPLDSIKYRVSFTVEGPAADYFIEAEGWAYNKTGKDWASKFSKKDTLAPGTYKWRWNKTIPSEAKPGSKAIYRITIKMYDQKKGMLLDEEEKTKKFTIAN